MKTKKNLTDYSIEELKSKKKTFQSIFISFGLLMLLASIFLIYSAISTKNYAFLAIAMGSFSAIVPLLIQLAQINKEIKSRGN